MVVILPLSLIALCQYLIVACYLNYCKAAQFPGPFLAKISNAWLLYHGLSGKLDQINSAVIEKYGTVALASLPLPTLKLSRLTGAHCARQDPHQRPCHTPTHVQPSLQLPSRHLLRRIFL